MDFVAQRSLSNPRHRRTDIQTLLENGEIFYRTRNLLLDAAARFARCLDANTTRFCRVEIVRNPKAKSDACWFVQFSSVNPDRVKDMYASMEDARQHRAETEGLDYVIVHNDDNPGTFFVFNPLSGETYEGTTRDCGCSDYAYRMRSIGSICKHSRAIILQLKLDMVAGFTPVTSDPERRERCRVGASVDFP
jgi:hypothetical protein